MGLILRMFVLIQGQTYHRTAWALPVGPKPRGRPVLETQTGSRKSAYDSNAVSYACLGSYESRGQSSGSWRNKVTRPVSIGGPGFDAPKQGQINIEAIGAPIINLAL